MKTSRMLQMFALLAVVAALVCGPQMLAQDYHRPRSNKIMVSLQKSHSNTVRAQATPVPNSYSLQASFIDDYPIISANADGMDLWPCLDLYLGVAGSNPNCPTLGDPLVPFPLGAVVTGFPAFGWPLENTQGGGNSFGCDALVNGTTGPLASQYHPCGQIFTSYEDDTNDSTNDLLQRVVVTSV
jgi:hypothetical protein